MDRAGRDVFGNAADGTNAFGQADRVFAPEASNMVNRGAMREAADELFKHLGLFREVGPLFWACCLLAFGRHPDGDVQPTERTKYDVDAKKFENLGVGYGGLRGNEVLTNCVDHNDQVVLTMDKGSMNHRMLAKLLKKIEVLQDPISQT